MESFFEIRELNAMMNIFKENRTFPPDIDFIFEYVDMANIKMDKFTFGLLFGAAYSSRQRLDIIEKMLFEMRNRYLL